MEKLEKDKSAIGSALELLSVDCLRWYHCMVGQGEQVSDLSEQVSDFSNVLSNVADHGPNTTDLYSCLSNKVAQLQASTATSQ